MPDPSLSWPSLGDAPPQAGDDTRPTGADIDQLRTDLGRAGSTQSTGLVDAALRLVTGLANLTVRGADGVSITLDRRGRMMTAASSDDTIRRMDEHQYTTGEGPWLSAASKGVWFHSGRLADEDRWPNFVPRAIEEGIASIMSTPLLISTVPIGAINMYSRTGDVFGPAEKEVATFFAKRAADILGEAAEQDEDQGTRISLALTSRDIIAMAQGVHMARLGLSAEDAAAELYRTARTKAITVRAEAVAVLESTGTDGSGPEDRHG